MSTNQSLIESLPPLPPSKQFNGNKFTPEQFIFLRNINKSALTRQEELILSEAVGFYNQCIPLLKQLNLSTISDTQATIILEYLHKVFNVHLFVFHQIVIDAIFRLTVVKNSFCENGKVRSVEFIKYPTVDVNKQNNVYNRANSPNTTVMYASFFKNVTIRETKPSVGERIIISTWENVDRQLVMAFPITNASLPVNEAVTKSTKNFKDLCTYYHPVMAELMNCYLSFYAQEFIKDTSVTSLRKFEYLFSAFFADKSLSKIPMGIDNIPEIDALLYPSVAYNHRFENLALKPEAVEKYLKVIFLREYEIVETNYDNLIDPLSNPAKLKLIRESKEISGTRIRWNDD